MHVIAVVSPGLEQQCAQELLELGANSIIPAKRFVSFQADMACFYRLNLRARLPFRFLRELSSFHCDSPKSLYFSVQNSVEWRQWLNPSMTFRVDVSGMCTGLNHSHFSALQVKNAIIDTQLKLWGKRSSIDIESPDLCFHLHLADKGSTLSLDSSARSLHKRGYRPAMGLAPIKENLAAGLVRLSGWNGTTPLVDPLCGSGTFLIEAVSLALNLPLGLQRNFLLKNWPDFNQNIWNKELDLINKNNYFNHELPPIIGCEYDNEIAKQALENIKLAGLEKYIKIQKSHFSKLIFPSIPGTIICNPPYGKRISSEKKLISLYTDLGYFLKTNAAGWDFWLLSGNSSLTSYLKMKKSKKIPISNGGIDCRWLKYEIF